jgi:hypothetical protein
VATIFFARNPNHDELARSLRHQGIRVGEIIAYRAWRVMVSGWFRKRDDRLRSVFMKITCGTPISQRPEIYERMAYIRSET